MLVRFYVVSFIVIATGLILECWSASTLESAEISATVRTGIVIDAGSGGSRLHVYTWEPRIFKTSPPPLSYPESHGLWTSRIAPGVANFAENMGGIHDHLQPLIDFAKSVIKPGDYAHVPIYFYATGGMRLLSTGKRDAIIDVVRNLFINDTFCPFFFKRNFARVISGEEEAIFSWAATNLLMKTLLPASKGAGVVYDVNSTYGTVDLGGASTQIAYFLPSQDILEGLYKFQIGNQKIWNVFTKSFLSFGVVSARERHMGKLIDAYLSRIPKGVNLTDLRTENPCFYAGYSETAKDQKHKHQIEVTGPELPLSDQLEQCMNLLRPLMEKSHNGFCNEVYHGDCSIAGSYQPPLPNGAEGKFIGTSSLTVPWAFLQLPASATVNMIKERASTICQMNFDDIMFYFEVNFSGDAASSVAGALPYFCFQSSYIIVLLEDGYGFKGNQSLTVLEEVDGTRMGWALGAILYEINEYPWELRASPNDNNYVGTSGQSWISLILAALSGFLLGGIGAVFVYRHLTQHPYNRLSNSDNLDGYEYDNMHRVSMTENVRRCGTDYGSSSAGIGAGAGVGSAYSTGSTVGRYENFTDSSYELPETERGLELSAAAANSLQSNIDKDYKSNNNGNNKGKNVNSNGNSNVSGQGSSYQRSGKAAINGVDLL